MDVSYNLIKELKNNAWQFLRVLPNIEASYNLIKELKNNAWRFHRVLLNIEVLV